MQNCLPNKPSAGCLHRTELSGAGLNAQRGGGVFPARRPPLLREEEDFKDVSPTEDLSPTALYSFQQKKPSSNRLAKDIGKASKTKGETNKMQ